MKSQKRSCRGLALVHTLALITLVMVAAFALATSCLSQLNLSARYAQRTQADNTARAAMTEFVLRAEALESGDVTTMPPPVLQAFQGKEVLLQSSSPIDGTARLLLNRCVDNSSNPFPVASFFDSPGVKSVPPFSVSVVYEVMLGSRSYLYESLIQQRWPYTLTAPESIFVCGRIGPDGTPESQQIPSQYWSVASQIKGRVLALQGSVGVQGDPVAGEIPGGRNAGRLKTPIVVSDNTYKALYPFAAAGGLAGFSEFFQLGGFVNPVDRFTLGGPVTLVDFDLGSGNGRPLWTGLAWKQSTREAVVKGNVDLMENLTSTEEQSSVHPSVKIYDGNSHRGQVRRNRTYGGLDPAGLTARQRMRKMFTKPSSESWQPINIGSHPSNQIVVKRDGPSGPDVYVVPSGRCHQSGHLAPRPLGYTINPETGQIVYTGEGAKGSLNLQDVSLSVEGDLDLEQYILRGSGATLVVGGTLTMDGGYLDAGDNGMVIFCRRLIMKAQGEINGLIVVEKGAAIYGAGSSDGVVPAAPGLTIRGGLLVGGADLLIQPPTTYNPDGVSNPLLPLSIDQLLLVSVNMEYSPRYLRGLNQYGPREVVATELRQ